MSLDRPPTSSFQRALLWTAGVIGVPALLSLLGGGVAGFYAFWFLALLIWLGAIVVAVGLLIAGRGSAAGGVFTGQALSTLTLFVTCLANIGSAG